MSTRHQAGVWLAFSAGMFAEASLHAAQFTGEDITESEALAGFLDNCGDAMKALGVTTADAIGAYEGGRQMAVECRVEGSAKVARVVEDPPPNVEPLRLMPPPDRSKN